MNRNRSRLAKLARQEWNRQMDEWDGVALVTMDAQSGHPVVVLAEDYQRNLAVPMMDWFDGLSPRDRAAQRESA